MMNSIQHAAIAMSLSVVCGTVSAQDVAVVSELEITEGLGGFTGDLDPLDLFGWSVANIGDLDGNGRVEIAVGSPKDDDGPGQDAGAVYILFLNLDGTVASHQKIGATSGNLSGVLAGDRFGSSIAPLGDMDKDGVPDIIVGARSDDEGATGCPGAGCSSGSVTILFLNPDGTVRDQQKISRAEGGLPDDPDDWGKHFGTSVDAIGDVNGDGIVDIAVGMPQYSVCSCVSPQHYQETTGSVWIIMLNQDGTVLDSTLIANGRSGFPEDANATADFFGWEVAGIGDLDGDGIPDLAVNASNADDGAIGDCTDYADYHSCNTGSVWILFLNPDGSVRDHQKISKTSGGFPFPLDDGDQFGAGVARAGDLDADGVPDLIAAGSGDDDGCVDCGAIYVLYLHRDGTVKDGRKISMTSGGLQGPLEVEAFFGWGLDLLGDFQGDGFPDIVAGAQGDDSGELNAGSVRLLFLDSDLVRYGCASPEGSLLLVGGAPRLGTRVTLGLQNPFESQAAGSLSFLVGSTAPAFSLCGFPLPGFGMDPNDPTGELLVDLFPPNPVLVLPGTALASPDDRAEVSIDIPTDPSLDGLELYFQGVLLDASPAASIRRGLTDGLRLRLHS